MTFLPEAHDPARERMYRVARIRRHEQSARQYRHTLVLSEDGEVAELGHVDVIGKPTLLGASIRDANGAEWHLTPNRKVMPSQWTLSDVAGMAVLRIDGMIGGKLLNPLHRTSVAVFDATGVEHFRITDIRSGVADRIIGPGPSDWTAMRDDLEVGGIITLPMPSSSPGTALAMT